MKIAKEIAEEALLAHGNITGPNAGFMVISENAIATIANEKLELVREALQEAVTLIDSAGDEQEEGAAQSGPEFWHNQALLIGDALAMLSDEEEL